MSLFLRLKAFLLTVAAILAYFGFTCNAAEPPVRRRANNEMKIALTFDDGPCKEYTEEILEILDEYGIKATFFVIGKCCENYPELLESIHSHGHEIGNHTYSHSRMRKLESKTLKEEIRRTEEIVYEIISVRTTLFRPPEGAYSDEIGEICDSLGYRTVLWSVDTCDWRRPDADAIVSTVVKNTASGSIILCHDNVVGKSNTPEALREFIPCLIRQGYEFVTVSELISASTLRASEP